ncbi:MAG TPA: S8 family serine peptidase [Steroidobacteraceae bacterium]|jgi:subtilisin family serine protease|nr:S8 family serine peptidase [Steroidobacteraceae bacterium]
MRAKAFIFAVLMALSASAQLPRVPLPPVSVPGVQLPSLPEATRGIGGRLRELTGARALRAERLFDEHRAELDRDVRGDLVVRAEVIAIDITDDALALALKARFLVRRIHELPDLGMKITVLQTPEGMSATRGLKRLRKLDPQGSYDYNHVYFDGGEVGVGAAVQANGEARGVFGGPGRVGLIDGGVDTAHEVFKGIRIHHAGCDGKVVPSPHGTAVAYLLVSRNGVGEIFAADVYCGEAAGGAIDSVSEAFGWMARERVAVINVSLVGPRNKLMERVVKTLVARGHLIVAAVGNDGPAAPPLFPASYDGVIGVTAVDARHRVLIEACRGKQVDFAAKGTDFSAAAAAPDVFVPVRGTSFASPIIATMFASELDTPDPAQVQLALAKWKAVANDLGKPGRDDVYGEGELGDNADPHPPGQAN